MAYDNKSSRQPLHPLSQRALQPREPLPELKVLTLELPFHLKISAQPMPQRRRDLTREQNSY